MIEKIALLTDSGNDLDKDISPDLFILPLMIQVGKDTYTDGVDIDLDKVLDLLDEHKVTTSLPSAEYIVDTLDEIKKKGYTHVIINTISSGLSGTHNFIRLLVEDYEGLVIEVIDTKNISKASGYSIHLAADLIKEGKSFAEIIETIKERLDYNKVFFTVGSLEHLRRGGRIGLVAGTVANILSLRPVISCNEAGVYHSVSMSRGYRKAINKLINLAYDFIKDVKSYDITILVARTDDRTKETIDVISEKFSEAVNFEIKKVTPALGIHTGPTAMGIALRIREK